MWGASRCLLRRGCWSQGRCWQSSVPTWLEAGDCRFHSGNCAVWGPGLRPFKAVFGSPADAGMSTPLSLGLVCNCWLRWAWCPEQSEVSLVRQDEPHLGTATPEPTWQGRSGSALTPGPLHMPAGAGAGVTGESRALALPLVPGQWGGPPAGLGLTQLLLWSPNRPTGLLAGRRAEAACVDVATSLLPSPLFFPHNIVSPCCFSLLRP